MELCLPDLSEQVQLEHEGIEGPLKLNILTTNGGYLLKAATPPKQPSSCLHMEGPARGEVGDKMVNRTKKLKLSNLYPS